MKRISLLLPLLVATVARAAPAVRLADLNALTKLIVPRGELPEAERPALVDVAEAVAARDGTFLPTPQGVLLAAALERNLDSLPGPRPARALVELELSLARLGGPDSARLEQPFYRSLLGALGVAPADAQPRPDLPRELAEIGEWAAAAVEKPAAALPPAERSRARVRLLLARGRYADAEALARTELAAARPDPRWQAWLASALIGAGKGPAAAPFAAAAAASGGEARNLLLDAQQLRTRVASLARAEKTLKAAPGPALDDACKKFFTGLTAARAKAKSAGELAIACANVLWQDVYSDWLQRGVALIPRGSAGGALRASDLLRRLFGQGLPARPDDEERKPLLARFLDELKPLPLDAGDRRLVTLLGYLAAATRPIDWRASGPEERALVAALAAEAPCDASGFALRSVVERGDRARLGVFLESVARTCAAAPGGTGAAIDATELLLQLAHEIPSSSPVGADKVEALAAELARAHPDDPQALTAHADAVALHELASGKPRALGLEAALSRYEEAIAISTPASGATARGARESNAALLSLLLARLAGASSESRRTFLQRAANHLRVALAFGEEPPTIAVRAAVEVELKAGAAVTATDLARLPPGRARARAACHLARESSARGDAEATGKFLELAREPGPPDERKFNVDELSPDSAGTFKIVLDERTLRPLIDLKTSLYLAPSCDPKDVQPPRAAPRAP